MKTTIKGKMNGRSVTLTSDGENVTGDRVLGDLVVGCVASGRYANLGPEHPSIPAALDTPDGFMQTTVQFLDRHHYEIEGDAPVEPDPDPDIDT